MMVTVRVRVRVRVVMHIQRAVGPSACSFRVGAVVSAARAVSANDRGVPDQDAVDARTRPNGALAGTQNSTETARSGTSALG